MGLPIWRSPPPSPRPAAAALCEGPSRSAIRRRTSPRTSPRDTAHRFVPVSRASRSTTAHSSARSRSGNIDTLESRSSHAAALSLSSLNARLNDLQESAIHLRSQHRQLLEAQEAQHNENDNNDVEGSSSSSSGRTPVPAITNDYGLPYEPEYYRHFPVNAQYERSVSRYHTRLMRARQEIRRLEADGLQLNEQRRRLDRLHADFYSRHVPGVEPDAPTAFFHFLRSSRDDSEPVPQILSVPERFTSSPQPMIQETLSSGAVRASSSGSSSASSGPEMELPPLRRMGDRNVGDRSPERTIIEAYTVEEVIDELHDGLGDRDRSVDIDADLELDRPHAATEEEEETWNTMLSTIAPDDRLPSATSSFASDAASRSFSNSSGNSSRAASAFSAATAITVPDDGGCDTEEVWRTIGDRFNRGEDVPDELWVNAGVPVSTARILARSMRERL